MSMIPESIELTAEQRQLLAQVVVQTGKPWPKVLDEALASLHVQSSANGERNESVGDRMRRTGLLGCITDAPEDLSTNPKYMEGFGEGGK